MRGRIQIIFQGKYKSSLKQKSQMNLTFKPKSSTKAMRELLNYQRSKFIPWIGTQPEAKIGVELESFSEIEINKENQSLSEDKDTDGDE